MKALNDSKTWELVERPENQTVLSNCWIFKIKECNEFNIYKARLVARGFEQKEFSDISQLHAPVARLSTLRVLLSISNQYQLFLEQLDIKNAFLNRDLEETIFMEILEGFKIENKS